MPPCRLQGFRVLALARGWVSVDRRGCRGALACMVSALQKRLPVLPVHKGSVNTQGPQFLHYMDTIIQLARELDDLHRYWDREGGFYLANVLRYIEQNPRVPLTDVPDITRVRGYGGRSPDAVLYQVL